jgi:hypothetical protein
VVTLGASVPTGETETSGGTDAEGGGFAMPGAEGVCVGASLLGAHPVSSNMETIKTARNFFIGASQFVQYQYFGANL